MSGEVIESYKTPLLLYHPQLAAYTNYDKVVSFVVLLALFRNDKSFIKVLKALYILLASSLKSKF